MSRHRVLRAITRLNIGGPARQAVLLHRVLPERGFASRLLVGTEAPSEGRIDPGPFGVTHVPELRRPIDPIADRRAYRAIDRLVTAWRPDVVHTHTAKAGALARVAASRRGVPVVVHTFHGHVLEGYFPKPMERAVAFIERRLAERTHALLAISPQIRDELLGSGIGRPSQWHVVPVGVELSPLLGADVDPVQARRTLDLPEAPTVGIVGRLTAIKDHDTFFEAARLIHAARPDVSFVIAGDGERRAELEAVGSSLGGRVRLLGWVDDLPNLYGALDVIALTSRNEGTPLSLIEAGASSRPVVATDVGGVRDVVVDGRSGTLVPREDPGAVADAVIALLDEPDRARAFGDAARAHVRERFSADRLVAFLTDLYGDLLGKSRR